MKNSKTENTVVNKINKTKLAFAEFLAKAEAKVEELEIAKAKAREEKKVTTTSLSAAVNVIIEIYNAGEKGILISEIMKKKPINYIYKGELKTSYSYDSVNRDWNKANYPIQPKNQFLIDKGVEVVFQVEEGKPCKSLKCNHNNRIILPEVFAEDVRSWLLEQTNVKEEYLNRK